MDEKLDKSGINHEVLASTEDFEKDLKLNSSAFEVLERDFEDVINELLGEASLEKFRLEYEKLHRALKKSHDQEKRLVKKCRELNNEILSNQAKIKTALKLSQEDQKTIAHLQKEMEKTWKLVYTAQEKEQRAMDTINALKEELINLSQLLDKSSHVGSDQEVLIEELRNQIHDFEATVTNQTIQITDFERNIQLIQKLNSDLQSEKVNLLSSISDLNNELEKKDKELSKVIKKRDKLQKENETSNLTNEENKRHIEKLSDDIHNVKSSNVDLMNQLKESKTSLSKHLKEYEILYNKSNSVTQELENQVARFKDKRQEVFNLETELKFANQEIARLSADKTLWEKKFDKEHRDIAHYKEMAESAKIPLMLAKQEIELLKQDILNLQRAEHDIKSRADFVLKEKEKQIQITEKAENKIKENLNIISEHTRIERELEDEISLYKREIMDLRRTLSSLQLDRDRLAVEVENQRSNYLSSEEEIKLRDVQINEIGAKVTEGEGKLRHQLQLYETLRNDRNGLAKQLKDCQEELGTLKKDLLVYVQQTKQLQDELSLKEQQVMKEQYETTRLEKVKDALQVELSKKNDLFRTDHDLVAQYEKEIKALTTLVKKVDDEMLDQKREYDHLINERDVLGMQLIRRNDEIALLLEKIRIQESALRIGESQYNERLNDIQILKTKIKDINREYSLTKNSHIKISELKRNIVQLEKDLLQERTRVTALSEELENPMNIHRWRKLEGSDPATYELIQKVQMLQKKLISKTEEVVEKSLVLQDKDRLYTELQDVLKRQPGPEVGEQLITYQRNLRSKNTQMKVMISELNMYQAQSHEYKYEMERLTREIQDLKRKYFQQKKTQETDILLNASGGGSYEGSLESYGTTGGGGSTTTAASVMMSRTAPNMTAKTRIAGGGFVIKQPF